MPPAAITLTYAAAKGISLSKFADRSLALFEGIAMNPATTKSGVGTKIRRGINRVSKTSTIPNTDMGRVSRAVKIIIER